MKHPIPGPFYELFDTYLTTTQQIQFSLQQYFVAGYPQRRRGCDGLSQLSPQIEDRDLVIISAHSLGSQELHQIIHIMAQEWGISCEQIGNSRLQALYGLHILDSLYSLERAK